MCLCEIPVRANLSKINYARKCEARGPLETKRVPGHTLLTESFDPVKRFPQQYQPVRGHPQLYLGFSTKSGAVKAPIPLNSFALGKGRLNLEVY